MDAEVPHFPGAKAPPATRWSFCYLGGLNHH
jgi:hypothetical protein